MQQNPNITDLKSKITEGFSFESLEVCEIERLCLNPIDEEQIDEMAPYCLKQWKEIDCDIWRSNWSAFGFFSAQGLLRFIPSLMICSIENQKSCRLACLWFVRSMSNTDSSRILERNNEFLKVLDLNQKFCITLWLHWLADQPLIGISCSELEDVISLFE